MPAPGSPGTRNMSSPPIKIGERPVTVANIRLSANGPVQRVRHPFRVSAVVTGIAGGVDADSDWLKARFRLSDVGSVIEPKDAVELARTPTASAAGTRSEASWSVSTNDPSLHTYVLNVYDAQGVSFQGDKSLTITVDPTWWFYFQKVSAPIIGFGGSLLTLPGILAYLKDRRDARKKRSGQQALKAKHAKSAPVS